MLGWFLCEEEVDKAMEDFLVEKSAVETRPNRVSNAVTNECGSRPLTSIHKYFHSEALNVLQQVIAVKLRQRIFPYAACEISTCKGNNIGTAVSCDGCLLRFHMKCVGVTEAKPVVNNTGF